MCKGRVLLVDDDARFMELMQDILEMENYELTVYSGPECIKELNDRQPEIILVDYCLNGANGIKMYQQLKDHSVTVGLPVVLLSAYPETQIPFRNIPHTVFIPKPFDLWDFLACLNELIRRHRGQFA